MASAFAETREARPPPNKFEGATLAFIKFEGVQN